MVNNIELNSTSRKWNYLVVGGGAGAGRNGSGSTVICFELLAVVRGRNQYTGSSWVCFFCYQTQWMEERQHYRCKYWWYSFCYYGTSEDATIPYIRSFAGTGGLPSRWCNGTRTHFQAFCCLLVDAGNQQYFFVDNIVFLCTGDMAMHIDIKSSVINLLEGSLGIHYKYLCGQLK